MLGHSILGDKKYNSQIASKSINKNLMQMEIKQNKNSNSFVPKEFLNKRICIYVFYFMRDEKSFINIGMKW